MLRKTWILALLLGTAAACGGDDEPAAMKGTVNIQMARTTVQQSVMLRMAVDAMNGPSVATATTGLNSSTFGLVTPAQTAMGALLADGVEAVAQAQSTGTQTCTATKCTFTNYGNAAATIDGTVNVAPGTGDAKKIDWTLTFKSGAGVGALSYTGKGKLEVSATSLAGELWSTLNVSNPTGAPSGTTSAESYAKYTAVVISAGIPTAGTVYAKLKSSVTAGGQSGSQAYEGTIEFK